MQVWQQKYQEERRKNENLLQLQKSVFSDNDEFIKAFAKLRNCSLNLRGEESMDEGEEISPEQAAILVDDVVGMLRKSVRTCECERWKSLYQRESEQTLKLSRHSQELIAKLKEKEQQEQADRVEVAALLADYLQLYKKQFYLPEKEEKDTEKKKKEHARSKSKGKPTQQSQTERKSKISVNAELTPKEENHIKLTLERMERDLTQLHREIEELRDKNMEKEQLIRLYRIKQRKQMLYGGEGID